MSKSTIDLQFIEMIQKRLQNDPDSAFVAQREELGQVYDRIRQNLSAGHDDRSNEGLFPEYIRANPQLLTALSEELVQEILNYVAGVCGYYRMIKSLRPLSNEEKDIGRQLTRLLQEAQDLL
jgi:hypothetical protein